MPEIFLEFIGDASLWMLPLLVVLAVWGKLNWDALNHPAKKASFDRAVGWLREDSFGQLYLRALGGLMDGVGDWIGDRQALNPAYVTVAQPKGVVQRVFGFNPFTPKSYEKCLWLAFMYPVLAYLLAWAAGAGGQVGSVSLFDDESAGLTVRMRCLLLGGNAFFVLAGIWFIRRWRGWRQWLALLVVLLLAALLAGRVGSEDSVLVILSVLLIIFLILFVPLYLGGWLTGLWVYRSASRAHETIYSVAVAVAFAVAIVGAVAGAVAGAVVGAIVGAGAVVGVGAVAGAVVGAVAVAVAGVGVGVGAVAGAGVAIVLLRFFQEHSENRGRAGQFWLAYSVLLLILGAVSLKVNANPTYMLFILLWLLLPLVNAPLDWLSLGVTRGLLQAVRAGNHSGWRALAWAGADLLLALIFLFLITAVLVGVTALGNAVAGKTLVDIGCILSKVQADTTHPDHWWIYFMLLSTLVPTLIHFALAGGAATLWLPRKWRMQLADGLEHDMHKTFGAWVYLTFTPVVGFVLVPVGLLWVLWWLLTANGGALGTLLLVWAEGLAQWADPGMALVCGVGG